MTVSSPPPALALDAYRGLVSLDTPFTPPAPASAGRTVQTNRCIRIVNPHASVGFDFRKFRGKFRGHDRRFNNFEAREIAIRHGQLQFASNLNRGNGLASANFCKVRLQDSRVELKQLATIGLHRPG